MFAPSFLPRPHRPSSQNVESLLAFFGMEGQDMNRTVICAAMATVFVCLATGLCSASPVVVDVTTAGYNTVSAISADGTASTFASGMNYPEGLAFDSLGNLYTANWGDSTISKITPGGTATTFVTGMHRYSANAPGRLTPTPLVSAHR